MLKPILNTILREHNCIDNGISEKIDEIVMPMIEQTIRGEIQVVNLASSVLPHLVHLPEDEAAQTAIDYAVCLQEKLQRRLKHANKSFKVDH